MIPNQNINNESRLQNTRLHLYCREIKSSVNKEQDQVLLKTYNSNRDGYFPHNQLLLNDENNRQKQQTILNIVLFEPEIPWNTGNIGRICVGLNLKLHLIEPLGFEISHPWVKRAGLDYWEHLQLQTYKSFTEFQLAHNDPVFYYATTKSNVCYSDVKYNKGEFIVFGKETRGLPEYFHQNYPMQGINIPMAKQIRSINLSNSVSIIAYEAYRQIMQVNKQQL